MTMWITIIGAILLYVIGFFLGIKYERDSVLDDTVGVLAEINKYNHEVEAVTYYYSEEAYNKKIQQLKEDGEEYYE